MDGTAGVALTARLDGEPYAYSAIQPAVAMDGTAGVALTARLDGEPFAYTARSGHGWHCGREDRAGEGTRTLDIQLGKLALYQLSYARGPSKSSRWPAGCYRRMPMRPPLGF